MRYGNYSKRIRLLLSSNKKKWLFGTSMMYLILLGENYRLRVENKSLLYRNKHLEILN